MGMEERIQSHVSHVGAKGTRRGIAHRIKGLIKVKYIGKKSAEKISGILELFLESDNPLEWLNQEAQ